MPYLPIILFAGAYLAAELAWAIPLAGRRAGATVAAP
jgi:hypothetical protein